MRTSVKAILFITVLLALHASVFSQQVAKTIPNSTSPDGLIGFLEFRPSDYGSQKHPLIIFLHGIGERGNGTSQIGSVKNNAIPRFCANGASMRFTVAGQTSSFIVLSPQLSSYYGYWPTFYIKEMIKYAKANLQVDPNRIYLTGLSLGGGGVWRSITEVENGDYSFDAGIAAAAPVCGTQEMNDAAYCATIGANHLPIWGFHSMDDGVVGVGQTQHGQWLSNTCGVTPASKFTYYQSGNHGGAWINAYDTGHITTTVNGGGSFTANPNLYEWFLSNTRSTAQTTPSYTPPAANAGNSQTITLPVSIVNLAGAGTGTSGATISSYSWTKTSGPSSFIISNPNTAATLVTGLAQGTYVFTLTVTDNHGLTGSSSVSITVNALAAIVNQAPVANAGANKIITLPANTATLDGSASKDPDGSIVAFRWTQTGGPAGPVMASRDAMTTNITGLVAGNYTYVLEITDNGGLKGYAAITITVNFGATTAASPSNQSPVANAGANKTITLPTSTVTLDGAGSKDPDGSIIAYRWTQTAGPAGPVMTTRDAMTTNVTGLVAGNYTYILEITDNGGLKAYSAVNITVNPGTAANPPSPGNQAPVANAGANKIITLPISTVTLDASASKDPDGSIIAYRWTQTGGPLGAVMATRDAMTTNVTGLVAGTYLYILEIIDNGGLKGYAAVTITANAASAAAGNLLGYIKISVGPYQACDDASSAGRIAVYGTGIANGSYLYSDAAMTQKYDGGWNWFSFTPVLGGAATYAFAIYPVGSIGLLRSCNNGARIAAVPSAATTAEPDEAVLRSLKEASTAGTAANAGAAAVIEVKPGIYPNPVQTSATIELTSADNSVKTISLYNSSGVLITKYTWQTIKGYNLFPLKNLAGLTKGLYIINIRESNGKSAGTLKFLKL